MGDECEDICECVWSHEFAMQRLLAFIRQNQNHCTDTECIDISGRMQPSGPTATSDSTFTITAVLMLIAMFMYIVRPETLLSLTSTKRRRTQGGNDDSGPPPPAPPAVN